MIGWIVKLWTNSFIETIRLGNNRVLVQIEMQGVIVMMLTYTVLIAVLGALAGIGIWHILAKIFKWYK